MKKIKLDKETTKKFKEALDVFMVNPKKGNAMLDKIHEEQQHDDAEEFYCEFRKCDVTYSNICQYCVAAIYFEARNSDCPFYKK